MPVATVNGVPIAYKLHQPTAGHQSRPQPVSDGAIHSAAIGSHVNGVQQTTASLPPPLSGAVPTAMHALAAEQTRSSAGVGEEAQRVLFICGLDARHDTEYFRHLIEHFAAQGCTVCSFDNRGVGGSHKPSQAEEYSTDAMAGDTLGLMDHLRWRTAHVVGMSMGGMIGTKVAAAAPERVQSLTVLSSTGFGHHMVLSMLSSPLLALKGMGMFPLQTRVRANLQSNFSSAYLRKRTAGGDTRLRHMTRVIMEAFAALSPEQVQAVKDHEKAPGHMGQLRAVLKHRLEPPEAEAIRKAGMPRQVLSGRHDPIAGRRYARRLAKYLDCPVVITGAAHSGITIESLDELGPALETVILGGKRTSSEVWASTAVEARARTESSVMSREVFTA